MSAAFAASFLLVHFILLVQGQVPGDLRLVRDGRSSISYSYGRLQVYVGGQWGEVCSDDFTMTERDVACHQLGYIDSIDSNDTFNSYGSVGDLMLSEVDCFGNGDYLHLLRCSYKHGLHSCQQNYVSLYCNTTNIWDTPYNGQLRLINRIYTSQGIVQVYCNGRWGTICERDSFNRVAADLICRQLGYTSARSYDYTRYYSYSSGPIWLDSLNCAPSSSVCLGTCSTCPSAPSTRCTSHYYDLTIQCVYEALHYTLGSNVSSCSDIETITRPRLGEVRLVSGGVAEVVYGENDNIFDNSWVPVCGSTVSSTNLFNAQTICQQLGYNQVTSYRTFPSAGPNDLQFNVSCSREYPHILWCPRTFTTCSTSLSVNCSSSGYYSGQVRLVGGDYPSEGRVEIYDGQQWATVPVTYPYSDSDESDSVCRQLGYTGAVTESYGTIPGNSEYVYRRPNCYGVRSCFSYCLYYPYQSSYVSSSTYYHSYDLVVNCTFNTSLRVAVGSMGNCQVNIPPTQSPNGSVSVILGITIPIAVVIIIGMVIIIVCCVCREMKSNKRRRRAAAAASGGQSVAYVVQPSGGGYVTTPQGMILVPVVPANNQIAPITVTDAEDEKDEPPSTDEYVPLPST